MPKTRKRIRKSLRQRGGGPEQKLSKNRSRKRLDDAIVFSRQSQTEANSPRASVVQPRPPNAARPQGHGQRPFIRHQPSQRQLQSAVDENILDATQQRNTAAYKLAEKQASNIMKYGIQPIEEETDAQISEGNLNIYKKKVDESYEYLIRKYPSIIPPSSNVPNTKYREYYDKYYDSVYFAIDANVSAAMDLVRSELNPYTRTTFIFKYSDNVRSEDSGHKDLIKRFSPPIPPPSFIRKHDYYLFYEAYYSNIKYFFTSAASSPLKPLYETFAENYDDEQIYLPELYDSVKHKWKNPEIHREFIELTKLYDKYVSAAAEERMYTSNLHYNYPVEVSEELPSKIKYYLDLKEGRVGTNLNHKLISTPYYKIYQNYKKELDYTVYGKRILIDDSLYKKYKDALNQFIEILRISVEQEEQVRESMARMEI